VIKHLSYSSVNLYKTCARAWRFRYLDKIETPVAAVLPFGSAFHNTIEAYLRLKADGLSPEPTVNIFNTAWGTQVEKESNINWGDETANTLLETGKRMTGPLDVSGGGPKWRADSLDVFLDGIDPQVIDGKPTIEKRITLQVPGVEVPVIGYIDLITSDGVPCDFKTASRAWYAKKAHEEMQPDFYLAALTQSGEAPADFRFRYYVFTKTKKPKAQIIETKRTPAQLFWMLGMVQEVWQGIQVGVFPPTGPGSWKCSAKYCEFWNICRGK
jgi:hypothetical protein